MYGQLKYQIQYGQFYLGSAQRKCVLKADADREGPDQTAHMRSLIRAFSVRLQNHSLLTIERTDKREGLDETVRMRRYLNLHIC